MFRKKCLQLKIVSESAQMSGYKTNELPNPKKLAPSEDPNLQKNPNDGEGFLSQKFTSSFRESTEMAFVHYGMMMDILKNLCNVQICPASAKLKPKPTTIVSGFMSLTPPPSSMHGREKLSVLSTLNCLYTAYSRFTKKTYLVAAFVP